MCPSGVCTELTEGRISSEKGKHELFMLLEWRSFDLAAVSTEGKGRDGMGDAPP